MPNLNKTQNSQDINESKMIKDKTEKVIEEYIKPNRKRKILSSKKEYTAQKRNREDILESSIVKERISNISDEKNNENYGTYKI